MFGAHSPCPIRLTSTDPIHGWSASQHARLASDLENLSRSMPVSVITVQVNTSSVQILSYIGRNGVGSANAPSVSHVSATHPCVITWNNSFVNDWDEIEQITIKHAVSTIEWSGSAKLTSVSAVVSGTNTVDTIVESGATTPYRMTIVAYGLCGQEKRIGDYGGAKEKTDNTTENVIPYCAQVYHAIRSSRGSSYTDKAYTLVDAENLAMARLLSAVFYRTPEKYSASATPARADENIDYWADVLNVPSNGNDKDWEIRERCAVHFKAAMGPNLSNVTDAVKSLLGDAFVDIHTYYEDDFDNPPTPTFWNAGDDDGGAYSIGGHTWLSRRAHIRIEAVEPPGMTRSEFLNLMNVQLFQLLDPMLPSWCTYNWSVGSDGFRIGVDQIGIDSI